MTRKSTGGTMKEKPILFSGPMVNAILDGRKTQTRRVVNAKRHPNLEVSDDGEPIYMHSSDCRGYCDYACGKKVLEQWTPYGVVGDRLWVRETWTSDGADIQRVLMAQRKIPIRCLYRANPADAKRVGTTFKWTPSIHMPRWASRITLEIIELRAERLQNISDTDSVSEGIPNGAYAINPRESFRSLWDDINSQRGFGWDANPWVWVIEFKKVQP